MSKLIYSCSIPQRHIEEMETWHSGILELHWDEW